MCRRGDGLELRAELRARRAAGRDATWRVIDVTHGPALPSEPEPGAGEWRTPVAAGPDAAAAVDGSAETAVEAHEALASR